MRYWTPPRRHQEIGFEYSHSFPVGKPWWIAPEAHFEVLPHFEKIHSESVYPFVHDLPGVKLWEAKYI